jgi:hypothetical protein
MVLMEKPHGRRPIPKPGIKRKDAIILNWIFKKEWWGSGVHGFCSG